MTTTGQQIADEAWTTLGDTNGATGVRWKTAEVLAGINEGQRATVVLRPEAYTVAGKLALAADTRQTLVGCSVTNGIQVLRVLRNWSADSATVGPAITRTAVAQLDVERPAWHSDTDTAVAHYDIDPSEPGAFYVWPKVTGGRRAEVIYSAVPPELASLAANISLGDEYRAALRYYLLFYTLSKRVQGSQAARNDAAAWYTLFQQALGLKGQAITAAAQANAAKESQA